MRQGFAITLIIVVLFLLWLINTGRYERFILAFTEAWEGVKRTGGGTGGSEPRTTQTPYGPVYGIPIPQGSVPPFPVKPLPFGSSFVPGGVFGDYSGYAGNPVVSLAGEPNETQQSYNAVMCSAGDVTACAGIIPDLARYPLNTVKQTLNGNLITTLGGLIRW